MAGVPWSRGRCEVCPWFPYLCHKGMGNGSGYLADDVVEAADQIAKMFEKTVNGEGTLVNQLRTSPALVNHSGVGCKKSCLGTGQQPKDVCCSTQAGVRWWGS